MTKSWHRRLAASFVGVALVVSVAACGDATPTTVTSTPMPVPTTTVAVPPTDAVQTNPDGSATTGTDGQDQAQDPTQLAERTVVITPPVAAVGDQIQVSGEGWPAGALVTASVCGNNFLNGSQDCAGTGAGQSSANPEGKFSLRVVIALPPKPCPCVIRVVSAGDVIGATTPFTLTGAPTGQPVQDFTTRAANVTATLTGSGPWTAWFGGPAQREAFVRVENNGTADLNPPALSLAFGKGDDPTTPLTYADGSSVTFKPLKPGEFDEVRVPVTIPGPAFGTYTLKGTFIGLDQLYFDGKQDLSQNSTFKVTTSTYPWGLAVVFWLMLQIPLLGLYRRRPVVVSAAPGPAAVATDSDGQWADDLIPFPSPVVDPHAPPPPPGYSSLPPA